MAFLSPLSSVAKNAEASQIIGTINSLVQAINANVVNPLNDVIYPTVPANPVNLLGVTVGNTGSPVVLTVNGVVPDANAGLIVASRGTSSRLSLGGDGVTSASATVHIVNTANSVNYLRVTSATSASPSLLIDLGGVSTDVGLVITSKGAGVVSLGGTTSAGASLRVTTVASAVNWVQAQGNVTGGTPILQSAGGDTNVGLVVTTQGSGVVSLASPNASSANASLRVVGLANSANFLQVTGATSAAATVQVAAAGSTADIGLLLLSQGAGVISLGGTTSATASLRVITSGTAAQQVTITGSATNPVIGVTGGSLVITPNLLVTGQITANNGTSGAPTLFGGGDNNSYFQNASNGNIVLRVANGGIVPAQFLYLANAVNYLQVTPATSATPQVEIASAGATAEVFLRLTPKGSSSSTIQFGNATCFQANGTQLNLIGSLGPTNSHSDIQKWLRIIDQAGTSLFIPCY